MSAMVFRLPFLGANGVEEDDFEDDALESPRDDVGFFPFPRGQPIETETGQETVAHAKRHSSKHEPAQPTPEKKPSQSQSATGSEEESAGKTTPPARGSTRKRQRTGIPDSHSENEPGSAVKKRRGGKKAQVIKDDIESPERDADQDGEEEDGGDWEVEKIVDARIEAETYIHWYRVKWKGWSANHNTWEPKKNLASCQDLIEEFEALKKKEARLAKKQNKNQ
ncbi:hypothetical protein MY11210_000147 [Beauveria gryllotalpidicola]